MDVQRLNEAFTTFAEASRTLEASYARLQERVRHLSSELEEKNRQLTDALADAERSKDFLGAVLQGIEEAIIVVDAEDRVVMMNRSAERLLGVTAEGATGRRFDVLGAVFTRAGSDTVLEAAGKRALVIVSRSGVVDAAGVPRGTVVLIRDITQLREMELRQERNERLIAMGEMAVKLVHEIRNPLCSIELFATMLERELGAAEQRNLAAGISQGISSLNTILTNMLMFARPLRPAMRPVQLDAVVDEALALVRPLMESRAVRLVRTPADRTVTGDGELIKQVVMNLLINAVQAMENGGLLTVALKDQDGMVVVDVSDTGPGIPPDLREKIFDPFFTTKDAGTGLGLAIASTIMRAHGGFIAVASEPGRGSTFTLSFPAAAGTAEAGNATSDCSARSDRCRP